MDSVSFAISTAVRDEAEIEVLYGVYFIDQAHHTTCY